MDIYTTLICVCLVALVILVIVSVIVSHAERKRARNNLKRVTLHDMTLVPICDGNQTSWMEVPR